jgi:hypothetical protein
MKRFSLVIVILTLCLSGLAVAQDKQPDATLELGVSPGFSWAGPLTYQGNNHDVMVVEGLSVSDAGITEARAFGKVYGLKKLVSFNGTYTPATAEGTLGGGAGAITMKNQNGVVIDLFTTTPGVNLKLAPSGVVFLIMD